MKQMIPFFRAKEKHPFHIVDSSQLPMLTAFSAFLLVMSFVFYFHPSSIVAMKQLDNLIFNISFMLFSSVLFTWFIYVVIESGQGHHTQAVRKGLRYGMALFIVSEMFLFFAFFWCFFHVSLSPAMAIGCIWPPKGIQSLDIWGLPLVNTLLLLSSGVTITLAHRAILKANMYSEHQKFSKHLLVTIILGITFLICQGIEYKYGVTFHWKENIFGSTFFLTTGFHGFHVTVGAIFLLFCLVRSLLTASPLVKKNSWIYFLFTNGYLLMLSQPPVNSLQKLHAIQNYLGKFAFTKYQHFGFEAAAWYWHFVDVVWLFLFMSVYWWSTAGTL